jgi:6-phosphogluconate dehydrogenase
VPESSFRGDRDFLITIMADALEASVISAYAQGFSLLKSGSDEFGYGLKLSDIARIWRGGCIIRSKLLPLIAEEFDREPASANLSISPYFSKVLNSNMPGLREVVKAAIGCAIPVPVLSQTISYFDSLAHDMLPSASLIQAMRDYFGAHTYERFDVQGVFHTEWNRENHPELTLSGV